MTENAEDIVKKAKTLMEQRKYADTEKMLLEAVKQYPQNTDVLDNLGLCYLFTGHNEHALHYLTQGHQIDPNDLEILAHMNTACTALSRDDDCLSISQRMTQLAPTDNTAWHSYASALLNLKRYDESIQACDKSIELNSASFSPYYTKALALYYMQRLDEAEIEIRKSIERRSELPQLWEILTAILEDSGKVEEAKEAKQHWEELKG